MTVRSRRSGGLDLRSGLRIDAPPIFVPWETAEGNLAPLFGTAVRCVKTGYWTVPVCVFGDLDCCLGFHFSKAGRLAEFELFRNRPMDLAASFADFQQHLERAFGLATWTEPGQIDFPCCKWLVPGVEVLHYVIDRFGLEEHVRIRQCWYGALGKLEVW